MRKTFGIIAVFFVPLVGFRISQASASELSRSEIENLVSELSIAQSEGYSAGTRFKECPKEG